MSYEGSVQCICEAGHLTNRDAYADGYIDGKPPGCDEDDCGLPIVWRNHVDETNAEDVGYINPCDLLAFQTSADGVAPITYRQPTVQETLRLQSYISHWSAELADGTIGTSSFPVYAALYSEAGVQAQAAKEQDRNDEKDAVIAAKVRKKLARKAKAGNQ